MFKCVKCGNDSALGERPIRVVVATRKKAYPAFQRPNGTHDSGGVSHEIVREAAVHEGCVAAVQAMIAAADAQTQEAIAQAEAAAASYVVYASDSARGSSPFNGVNVVA